MASGTGKDFFGSPARTWLERYEELEDIAYPTVVVDDVVEPFGQGRMMTSTPYRSRSRSAERIDGDSDQRLTGEKEVRFDRNVTERSRSPLRSSANYGSLEDGINQTSPKSPHDISSLSIDDIVKRYSNPKELPRIDDREGSSSPSRDRSMSPRARSLSPKDGSKSPSEFSVGYVPPPTIPAQMTYSPYRGPIQDQIHTQPYYGPIISTIRTDFNELSPSPVRKGQGSGDAARIINKVHNQVSDERVEELSSRYRERMARKQNRQTKHYRSKSDNFRTDLDQGVPRSSVKGHDDWMLRKYENAMLQIEKLESSIKCLRMEVNSLTASKKQAEMRVSQLLFLIITIDLPYDTCPTHPIKKVK